ncbi:MFS transporter [Pontiella sp.]|uniref:MFS transporter n=1 Tax=Pontiella sp. TaxID=2837462 RepID=UPI003565DB8B
MPDSENSKNIQTFLRFTILQSIGTGIWMGSVFSLFIVIMAEQSGSLFGLRPNEVLGATSAVSGIVMLLLVLPAGFLADRWSREGTIRIAIGSGIIGVLFLMLGQSIYSIIIGLVFYGGFNALSGPAAEALLADSVASGNRSGIYTRIHATRQFGMTFGPLLSIFLFLWLGNTWELSILRRVMTAGLGFAMVSIFLLAGLKERHTLGDESESVHHAPGAERHQAARKGQRFVPMTILLANFIVGMGAGMTVKFFPVFFRDIYNLSPVQVQLILTLTFAVSAGLGILAQRISKKRGRAQMIVLVQALAIGCLASIAFYPAVIWLVPLFALRNALMNASQPLSRSIIMDFVPKKNRGTWNALQSVAWGIFWSASAVLGGFLIGDGNFRQCFLITAGVYAIGTLPILFIIPFVEQERSRDHQR